MYVMGLDIALASSGVVILDYETGRLVRAFAIVTTGSKKDEEDNYKQRLEVIREEVHGCYDYWNPVDVGMEDGFAGVNGLTGRQLAGAKAAALLGLPVGVNPCMVHNGALKKFATGNGNAKKPDMMAEVLRLCPELEDSPDWTKKSADDLADAYFIAKYTLEEIRGES